MIFSLQTLTSLTVLSSVITTTPAFLSPSALFRSTFKLPCNCSFKITTYAIGPSFCLEAKKRSIDYDNLSRNDEVELDDGAEKSGDRESDSQQHGSENGRKSKKTLTKEERSSSTTTPRRREYRSSTPAFSQSFVLQPIGEVSSVYRLCVGTPRQGLLAPNSRGRIDLYPNRISQDSVIDLQKFSHVWVVFIFHLNSNTDVADRSSKDETPRQFPAKIAPPALGGERVGVFSTRSPHRPNPVGVSLCKIDSITIPSKQKKKRPRGSAMEPYSINISGLDLVDGTPVVDIKPYVPHYDSVGYNEGGGGNVQGGDVGEVRLPEWVSEGLNKRRPVTFTPAAEQALETIMSSDKVYGMEFFGVASGRDESIESGLASIKACIIEVLGVDVRSAWQTGKARNGKSQAERSLRVKEVQKDNFVQAEHNKEGQSNNNSNTSKMCTQQLDNLLIKYTVGLVDKENGNSAVNTDGSGADDMVTVEDIKPIFQE